MGSLPEYFGRIVRLLLLTSQRRDEIGDLQWRELDLDCGVLNLPPERTKNNRPHVVPLAPAAAALLLNDRAAAVVDLTEARWGEVTISHDRHRLWINTEHGLVCRIYGIATLILPDSEG